MDSFNRLFLLLLGVLLVFGGTAGLLAATEWSDDLGLRSLPQPATLYQRLVDSVQTRPALGATILIALALILVVVGLLLAAAQLTVRHVPHLGTVVLQRQPRGITRLEPHAVARAAAADLEQLPGVVASSARLLTFNRTPHLQVDLALARGADPDTLREAAEEVWDRVCQTLGVGEVDVDLRLRFTDSGARVH